MAGDKASAGDRRIIGANGLAALIGALAGRGYTVIGPTVRDGAIVYEEISGADSLPAGWTDEQEAGTYRLKRRSDDAVFGYAVGVQSWKRYLHQPLLTLWKARRDGKKVTLDDSRPEAPRYAFLGVRACELNAISIQDRVFIGGEFIDRAYQTRREGVFVVAVNCGQAAATCFCTSMGTGPAVEDDHDLALTEIVGDGRHMFLVEIGSDAGADVMSGIDSEVASRSEIDEASAIVERTAGSMKRTLDREGARDLLTANLENARWDDVAERCLACANCTMVCPTCFCSTVEDVSDLSGEEAERRRRWDSCFTMDFSYMAGGALRSSTKARYRQWLTHKLSTWFDQFGTSGCVGCGRCIAWCPVGIDITEEVAAIAASDDRLKESTK